jgi:hypothetical protein
MSIYVRSFDQYGLNSDNGDLSKFSSEGESQDFLGLDSSKIDSTFFNAKDLSKEISFGTKLLCSQHTILIRPLYCKDNSLMLTYVSTDNEMKQKSLSLSPMTA